jgi:hypothetical protein
LVIGQIPKEKSVVEVALCFVENKQDILVAEKNKMPWR